LHQAEMDEQMRKDDKEALELIDVLRKQGRLLE
jgi:hypothetical protein